MLSEFIGTAEFNGRLATVVSKRLRGGAGRDVPCQVRVRRILVGNHGWQDDDESEVESRRSASDNGIDR